ncbi:hypothetical protein WR25_08098, partial [Diploscapter pachys]
MEKRQAECDWTIFLSYSLSVCFLCPFPSLPIHMSGSHDSPLTGLLTKQGNKPFKCPPSMSNSNAL